MIHFHLGHYRSNSGAMTLAKDNPIQCDIGIPSADSDLDCHRPDAIAYCLASLRTLMDCEGPVTPVN